MTDEDVETGTWVTRIGARPEVLHVRRCRFEILSGDDAGRAVEIAAPLVRIGRKGTDLELPDRTVSGVHAEISLTERGYRLRDLESSNGTFVGDVRIRDAYIVPGSTFAVGRTSLRFVPLADSVEVPLWNDTRYGELVGRSFAMRRVFDLIDKIAPSEATVLVSGETGVGKELVAQAVHERSQRADGPFVVLDCGAIPMHLMEAQLFGHERGAFTGATEARPGVFEAAHGGTLFLDEVGELPIDVQPKLLRAVETRCVSRIGTSSSIQCDVRLVAATNRDLAVETNRGHFRSDLYYRLAVALIDVPPLRERMEDVELLVRHFLGCFPDAATGALPEGFLERLRGYSWPGNVRELRNAVEQAVTLPEQFQLEAGSGSLWHIDTSVPFKAHKQRFIDEFDRRYITALLDDHDWNIAAAARAAGVDRMSVYKLLQRLDIARQGRVDDED